MTIELSTQEKTTIRTAAYGAVTLLSFAALADSPHKVATDGSLALTSATGVVGHVLADKKNDFKLEAKSAARLADQVFPALSESVRLLEAKSAEEAENFRTVVKIAVEAGSLAHSGEPSPALAEMVRKVHAALGSGE